MATFTIVLDTETTGLPNFSKNGFYPPSEITHYDSSRLLELGYGIYDEEGKLVRHFESLVKPNGFEVACTHIHGITATMAAEGSPVQDVLKQFAEDLECAHTVVAHNIMFDVNILLSECYRLGNTEIPTLLLSKKLSCTKEMAEKKYGKRLKLVNLYEKLFEPIEQEHRAMSDVIMCSRCYFGLKK